MSEEDFSRLEKKLKVSFENKDLLKQAFVHRSYLNENKDFPMDHNERLEFLGDAVMELIITEYLYKKYNNPEGDLTNWRSSLVKGETISKAAKKLGYEKYLYLSKGESKDRGKARDLILANCFEAVLGAMYLDHGYNTVKSFLERELIVYLSEIIKEGTYIDPKSKFQEVVQEEVGVTPHYRVVSESGPDHDKKFQVGAYVDETQVGLGSGNSKQEAQENAAANAMEEDKWKDLVKNA